MKRLFLNNESISNMRKKYFTYRKIMNPKEDTIVCLLSGEEKKKNAIKKMLLLEGEYRKINKCWSSIPINFRTENVNANPLKRIS